MKVERIETFAVGAGWKSRNPQGGEHEGRLRRGESSRRLAEGLEAFALA